MPTIVTSTVLDAPPDEVWALLRDFAAIGSWHPYLPVRDYVSGLTVRPADSGSLVEWTARFDCDEADEPKITAQVREGVFLPGLAALKERFAR